MKFGISTFAVLPEDYATFARKADGLGYDLLMASDHLACPPEVPSTYPYSANGEAPFTAFAPWLDPLVALTYMAAATQRIRLATNVYLLPLRHPTLTAKAVATLDVLSGGRVLLGVGTGWMREEFEAAGQDFDDRGKRAREIVEIMKRLWTQKTTDFRGQYYSLGPITFEPKPVQKPHPPIHFGGETPAALRRAAQLGDGWLGMRHSPESVRQVVARLQALRKEYGREKTPFEVTVQSGVRPTIDNLRRFQEAGVHRVSVAPWDRDRTSGIQEIVAGLERFAEQVMAKV